MYRFRNAPCRALLVLIAGLGVLLALGSTATADEPAPRAVPAARAYPRSFTTYDALTAYAVQIAADQSALNARRALSQAEATTIADALAANGRQVRRGKILDPDHTRDSAAAVAAVRARLGELAALDERLVAAGALTAAETGWRLPTDGQVTQPFGPSRLGLEPPRVWNGVAYAHFHEGVDLAGAWAAPVVAPARGRVVYSGVMGDGAMVVVLVHDGGLVSLYAHLDAWASPPPVSAGDEVAAGQRIGTVGMTGIVTGAHLHWAVWRDGALVDPLSLVRRP